MSRLEKSINNETKIVLQPPRLKGLRFFNWTEFVQESSTVYDSLVKQHPRAKDTCRKSSFLYARAICVERRIRANMPHTPEDSAIAKTIPPFSPQRIDCHLNDWLNFVQTEMNDEYELHPCTVYSLPLTRKIVEKDKQQHKIEVDQGKSFPWYSVYSEFMSTRPRQVTVDEALISKRDQYRACYDYFVYQAKLQQWEKWMEEREGKLSSIARSLISTKQYPKDESTFIRENRSLFDEIFPAPPKPIEVTKPQNGLDETLSQLGEVFVSTLKHHEVATEPKFLWDARMGEEYEALMRKYSSTLQVVDCKKDVYASKRSKLAYLALSTKETSGTIILKSLSSSVEQSVMRAYCIHKPYLTDEALSSKCEFKSGKVPQLKDKAARLSSCYILNEDKIQKDKAKVVKTSPPKAKPKSRTPSPPKRKEASPAPRKSSPPKIDFSTAQAPRQPSPKAPQPPKEMQTFGPTTEEWEVIKRDFLDDVERRNHDVPPEKRLATGADLDSILHRLKYQAFGAEENVLVKAILDAHGPGHKRTEPDTQPTTTTTTTTTMDIVK